MVLRSKWNYGKISKKIKFLDSASSEWEKVDEKTKEKFQAKAEKEKLKFEEEKGKWG